MDYPKYFSIYELLHSDTAYKRQIENIPTWIEMDNLHRLGIKILDPIREKWGSGICVNSGFRCERLNELVGGVPTSQHRYGEAGDIEARNGKNRELFNLIVEMINNGEIEVGQLIDEHNYSWIHISLPTEKHHNEIKHISK